MSRLRWVLLGGSCSLVVALLLVLGWQWRHPSTFVGYGGWRVGNRDWTAGRTAYIGMTFAEDDITGSVRIHGVAAHGLQDSTDASLTFLLCSLASGPDDGSVGLVGESDVHRQCSELVPAENTTMDLTHAELIVAVTPARAGRMSFSGVDLHYSDGWRNGTQRVGGDAWLRVRDPSGK